MNINVPVDRGQHESRRASISTCRPPAGRKRAVEEASPSSRRSTMATVPNDHRQADDMRRLEQRKGEQRIANLDGQAGLLQPVEQGGHLLLPHCRRPAAPHVVIGDQAAEDDDARPDQERDDGQRLDRGAVHEGRLPTAARGGGGRAGRAPRRARRSATSVIFSQNENVTSSRTGSPTTIRTPVASSSQSDPVSQGPNRRVVCCSVWSAHASPRIRRSIMSTDPITSAIPTICTD